MMNRPYGKVPVCVVLAAAVMLGVPAGIPAGEVKMNQAPPAQAPITLETTEAKPLQHVPEDVEVFFVVNVTWLRSALIAVLERAGKGDDAELKKGLEEIVVTFHKNFYQGRHERAYNGCRAALENVRTALDEKRRASDVPPDAGLIAAAAEAAAGTPEARVECPVDGQFVWDEAADELVCTVHGGKDAPIKLPPAPEPPTLKEAAAILRDSPAKYGLLIDRVYLFSGGAICGEGAVLATGSFDPDKVLNYMTVSAERRGIAPPRVQREADKTIFTNETVGGEGSVVIYGRDFILGGKPHGVEALMARDYRSLAGTPGRFADVISLISDEECAFGGKVYMPKGTQAAPLMVSEWPRWIRFELWKQRLDLAAEFSNASASAGLKQMLEVVKMQGSMSLGMKINELKENPSAAAPGPLGVSDPAVMQRLKETMDATELTTEEQLLNISVPLGKLEENLRFLIRSGAARKLKQAPGMMPMPKGLPSMPGMK